MKKITSFAAFTLLLEAGLLSRFLITTYDFIYNAASIIGFISNFIKNNNWCCLLNFVDEGGLLLLHNYREEQTTISKTIGTQG